MLFKYYWVIKNINNFLPLILFVYWEQSVIKQALLNRFSSLCYKCLCNFERQLWTLLPFSHMTLDTSFNLDDPGWPTSQEAAPLITGLAFLQKHSIVELKETSHVYQLPPILPTRKQGREKGIAYGSTVSGQSRNITSTLEVLGRQGLGLISLPQFPQYQA